MVGVQRDDEIIKLGRSCLLAVKEVSYRDSSREVLLGRGRGTLPVTCSVAIRIMLSLRLCAFVGP